MDFVELWVPLAEYFCNFFVRAVGEVDEPHVVVLAVFPATERFVAVLEPVGAHDVGKAGKMAKGVLHPESSLRLGCHGHEVTRFRVFTAGRLVVIATAILLGGKKEFRYQDGLVAQTAQPFEVIGCHPAIRDIDIVVGGNDIHRIIHGEQGILVIIERQAVAQ